MVIDGFVLDASVTAAWCFQNEASEKSTALLRSLRNTKAVVPGLWHFETANMLCQAERRHRITAQESLTALDSSHSSRSKPIRRRRDGRMGRSWCWRAYIASRRTTRPISTSPFAVAYPLPLAIATLNELLGAARSS